MWLVSRPTQNAGSSEFHLVIISYIYSLTNIYLEASIDLNMRRRIDLGQKVTGKEEARLEQKRQRWTARNKNRPEHENPFLSAIKPDNENYGEPGERYDELRSRLENLEFGNFPGYFNYRNNAAVPPTKTAVTTKSDTHKSDDTLVRSMESTIPEGQEINKNLSSDKIDKEHSNDKSGDVNIDKKSEPEKEVASSLESGLSDDRLGLMKKEWFGGKKVLDIGCNRGHITYAIAKMFEPELIMGIDIDFKMINMANRDLHLHVEDDLLKRSTDFRLNRAAKLLEDGTTCDSTSYTEHPDHFPLSSYISQGPLALSPMGACDQTVDRNEINTRCAGGDNIGGAATNTKQSCVGSADNKESSKVSAGQVDDDDDDRRPRDMTIGHYLEGADKQEEERRRRGRRQELNLFPNNIVFVEHNYVLSRDDLVEKQRAYFDTIVCLSVTKWIHLNYRDDGLKRFFRRMYKHLRPNGGLLILEAQPYDNYSRRKKLSDRLRANYYDIKFKPDQFDAYLLSDEVGFREILDSNTTEHECAGFKRPMKVYLK